MSQEKLNNHDADLFREKIQGFINITELAKRIRDSDLEWETKYDLIFSNHISVRLRNIAEGLGFEVKYYDPDTSYQADVIAFVDAYSNKAFELSKLHI